MLNKSDGIDDEAGEAASEGTAAHTVRERCLVDGLDVQDFAGDWIEADELFFEVTPEWVRYLQPGIERIREAKGFTWVFEHRTHMDPWIPGGFGTLDAGGISDDLIIIDDLKFGRGIIVDAERNKQLMIYALGFWMNYARTRTKATNFLLRIDQPRVEGRGSEWYTTLDELLAFAEELEKAVQRTLDPNAPLVPGVKQCRFCRAARNNRCESLDVFVLELMGLQPESLDVPFKEKPKLIATDTMDPERRSYVLQHESLVKSWLNNLRSSALSDAITGESPTPGFKAVGGLGDRQWKSQQQTEEFLRGKVPDKDLYNKSIKSPAQMEDVVGTRTWAKLQDYITRPEGAPSLVPESDKREALTPLSQLLDELPDIEEDEFDDIVGSATPHPNKRTSEQPIYDDLV